MLYDMLYYIVLLTHACVHLHSSHTTVRRRVALILSASSSYSQQEVIELEQTCAHTQSKVITMTTTFSHKCCAAVYTGFSFGSATRTRQSGRLLIKKLDPMELSQPAVVTVTHYHHSLPLCARTHTHTRASWSLYKHPHMTPVCMHTHSPTFRHTHTHKSTHEPRSMGGRVTLAPCFIKGAVTIGLLLLWWLLGYNKTECAGLMLVHSSPFFTWWQGRQT